MEFRSDSQVLASILSSHLFCFCRYFKLCQGLLTRWIFNPSPVAPLLISKWCSSKKNWYRRKASTQARLSDRAADISRGGWPRTGYGKETEAQDSWGNNIGTISTAAALMGIQQTHPMSLAKPSCEPELVNYLAGGCFLLLSTQKEIKKVLQSAIF